MSRFSGEIYKKNHDLFLYSCHLVIAVFIFRRSSSCGDFIGKSLHLDRDT